MRAVMLGCALFVFPIAAGAQQGTAVLKDRILAVVDEEPILSSDLERVIKLGLVSQVPSESDEVYRRRVLEALIDERVRFHEIDRFGFGEVPAEEVDEQVALIRGRFASEAVFSKALAEVGLNPQGLRQLVARQILVLTYVDERLGARVFVSLDEVTEYYRTVLAPEMQKKGQPVPPLEEVRDQIREVLKQQKLNQELAAWTDGLRAKADIVINPPPEPGKPLPPVVKRIPPSKP
jgi:parvulin-like peptidyl-prolyl isomerase